MAELPEGYIAPNIDSKTYAVDSKTLAKNGDVHLYIHYAPCSKLIYNPTTRLEHLTHTAPILDPFVEYSFKNDRRLEEARLKARTMGQTYSNPDSPDFIADDKERVRAIVPKLVDIVHEYYGDYGFKTLETVWNNAEAKAHVMIDGKPVLAKTISIGDMYKDSLVCRSLAPIMSVLMEEAGIPNHMVVSPVARNKDNRLDYGRALKLLSDNNTHALTEHDIGYHTYIITQQAIVETTYTGHKAGHKYAYDPIINDVTIEDIVHRGKAAFTRNGMIYGGHNGNGAYAYKATIAAWEKTYKDYHMGKISAAVSKPVDSFPTIQHGLPQAANKGIPAQSVKTPAR